MSRLKGSYWELVRTIRRGIQKAQKRVKVRVFENETKYEKAERVSFIFPFENSSLKKIILFCRSSFLTSFALEKHLT